MNRYWMVCEAADAGTWQRGVTPCLFDERTALKRGDPPRCIRHGALLFSDTTLNGMTREQAKAEIKGRIA